MKLSTFLLTIMLIMVGINTPISAAGMQPEEVPKDLKFLLGVYYGNGEQFLIRENNGNLELLYRFSREDYKFINPNIFPLKKERFDSYTINEAGPIYKSEIAVRFERDEEGFGITCKIGGNRYSRMFFGPEREEYFKFQQAENWDELSQNAQNALIPENLQEGVNAQLVEINEIDPSIKLDLRYATVNNPFNKVLIPSSKALLDKEAAIALSKVQKRLADYGYGLVVWEAYRPWFISKLAYDALPNNQKNMLPSPEKGFSHNTGRSIDLSLFYLDTNENVEMISDFDEPTPRQYSKFSGGSTIERYQRDLLQQLMALEGFKASEDEWWHFEYKPEIKYKHLNQSI